MCLRHGQTRSKFCTAPRRSPTLAYAQVPNEDRTVASTAAQYISILRVPCNAFHRLRMSEQRGEPILVTDGGYYDSLIARGSRDVFVVRMPLQVEYRIIVGDEYISLRFCVDDQHKYTEAVGGANTTIPILPLGSVEYVNRAIFGGGGQQGALSAF